MMFINPRWHSVAQQVAQNSQLTWYLVYMYKVNAISCMYYLPICAMLWWRIIYCISLALSNKTLWKEDVLWSCRQTTLVHSKLVFWCYAFCILILQVSGNIRLGAALQCCSVSWFHLTYMLWSKVLQGKNSWLFVTVKWLHRMCCVLLR